MSQPLLPCESASSTPPAEGKGREKEEGECCRKPLPFQEAGLTQEFKTTDTSVGTDKWHMAPRSLPTTRCRQGAKSLSPGKLFPQPAPSATQRGEPLPWTSSAAGQLKDPTSARASSPQRWCPPGSKSRGSCPPRATLCSHAHPSPPPSALGLRVPSVPNLESQERPRDNLPWHCRDQLSLYGEA